MSPELQRIRCVIMRGGTSRGLFVRESDMPADAVARDRMILALFGTPDRRQIDGLGGADVLTSKFAMIGPPSRSDADVDYTFVQVGIGNPTLDYNGNCGNISAAVGPFSIEEGFVRVVEPITRVRIHNTNTGTVFTAEVPVVDGQPAVEGDAVVAGVPGTGASIMLDYSRTVGAVTGRFFPTGHVRDTIDVPGVGAIDVTLADVANPVAYVKASDLGLSGTESPEGLDANRELNALLEWIRCQAAVMFRMTDRPEKATRDCSLFPLLTVVHRPAGYVTFGGATIVEDDIDIVVRMQALQQTHKAYAGTGTANLGATALVHGTVANDVLSERALREGRVRFGHPSGITVVDAAVEQHNGEWVATRIAYERTARRIMEGYAYIRVDRLQPSGTGELQESEPAREPDLVSIGAPSDLRTR
jgi:methylitaconate Delta-isomerase